MGNKGASIKIEEKVLESQEKINQEFWLTINLIKINQMQVFKNILRLIVLLMLQKLCSIHSKRSINLKEYQVSF